MKKVILTFYAVLAAAGPTIAGEAEIVGATASPSGSSWNFNVTLKHGDTGWDHYADAWRVVGPDGTVYGERILLHPHETEQPFTRSLSGVSIPDDVTEVQIEARDNVHGWAAETFRLDLKP
jgi:hypothetical protein